MNGLFDKVDEYIGDALCVAWDGCHKIYLAMDEVEAKWFTENYEYVVHGDKYALMSVVKEWWDDSCGLRFVSAVSHNADDPNAGFTSLIDQFADIAQDEWDDLEDE